MHADERVQKSLTEASRALQVSAAESVCSLQHRAQSVSANNPLTTGDPRMKSLTRREFSRLVTGAAAATAVAPLGLLNARMALAQGCTLASFAVPGFGPISPVLPNNTSELVDVPTPGESRR